MKTIFYFICAGILFFIASCNNAPVAENKVKTYEERFKELEAGIRNNPDWLASIDKKAKEKNIPLDSMIILDVSWMIDEQDGKHKPGTAQPTTTNSSSATGKKTREERIKEIEDGIRKSADWMNSITQKAKDRKIPVDSMIKLDATWMVDEQDGKHK